MTAVDPDACPHCWGNRTIWEQCEDGSLLPVACPRCNATGKRPTPPPATTPTHDPEDVC